jgi:uncharacterized membrane protein YkvA (DUF1232 family)
VNDAQLVSADETGVLRLLLQLPRYLRLVAGLLRDARVSRVDRLLVGASFVYAIFPFDILPDVIPVVGQIDDLALIAFALTRLFERAGREVIRAHWSGDPAELQPQRLRKLLWVASLFAGQRRRRRLRALGRGAA